MRRLGMRILCHQGDDLFDDSGASGRSARWTSFVAGYAYRMHRSCQRYTTDSPVPHMIVLMPSGDIGDDALPHGPDSRPPSEPALLHRLRTH